MDNSSQTVSQTLSVPNEIRGWNWGAFFLNWIWGLGNRTYIALLCLIPFVGLIMMFVLGAKGNQWAWQNGQWRDVTHFKKVQRLWGIIGLIVWVVGIGFWVAAFFAGITAIKSSASYQLATTTALQSQTLQADLGAPLKVGHFISGGFKESGGYGHARYAFKVEGTKHEAIIFTAMQKNADQWQIDSMDASIPALQKRVDIRIK